jgi:hypothetical protein
MAVQLLLVLALPFAAGAALFAGAVRVWRSLRPDDRPSGGWLALLAVVLLADGVLLLAFWWIVLVFDCHGGYECPV